MTKYVVNSGGTRRYPDLKRAFHHELVDRLGGKTKFLLCIFAQGREFWEGKFPEYCQSISDDMPAGVTATFELAMPDLFAEQCQAADVIYIYGGDDHLMQYWMKQFDLQKIFADKVVATVSAGSDMLATAYWTCDWRACQDGLGILPIRFIPHYKSDFGDNDPRGPIDWDKAYQELNEYGDPNLPIHALKEGEFKTFNVN